MRLGEIRNIVREVVGETTSLVIDQEPIYSGQAYQVRNYRNLIRVLDVLEGQKWNSLEYSGIESIKAGHSSGSAEVVLSADEFNTLNAYVASLNEKLPVFLGILDTMVTTQDEQAINIKLPAVVGGLEQLGELTIELAGTLKMVKIDGDVQFRGFDSGTDWYTIEVTGILTYQALLGCIKLAKECLKLRTEYHKSEKAKFEHKVAERTFNQQGEKAKLEDYIDNYIDQTLEDGIETILKELNGKNGFTKNEVQTRLVRATTSLIKEMGDGVEFHLSLNPPSFVREEDGSLIIDYSKVPASQIEGVKTPKQIKAPESKEE